MQKENIKRERERAKKRQQSDQRMVHIANDKKIAFVSTLIATLIDYVLVLAHPNCSVCDFTIALWISVLISILLKIN